MPSRSLSTKFETRAKALRQRYALPQPERIDRETGYLSELALSSGSYHSYTLNVITVNSYLDETQVFMA
ncbi:hypothetical protein [Legionella cincinnatiensis]|uniref:Uncharacterized protein n=1 Tax=Legionella cincinnatiensis TaxID=28085 RepID=A0A378IEI8_9GAMM|nr:hypothetical protein [Legionella cincinnatiensis]KTC92070.1 hypothetical protein Lcin_0849 [Legionella cincinnatiensis]STX33627.1 Uncharacterised protein [Legionella cincinnatiensis]